MNLNQNICLYYINIFVEYLDFSQYNMIYTYLNININTYMNNIYHFFI
jgi:hypothetical protein